MLELRSVTKKFGRTAAVRDLNMVCEDNEFFVIFGPAGAGKSTILHLVAGVIQPTRGEVFFNGHPCTHIPPEQRNISMAFENYALYSHLSVFENLAFPLRARKLKEKEIDRRVNAMAEILQITPLLQRRPGFLSGGQRQRVALGRALIREADLYLFDEPISHLDAKLRHRMRGELKAICAKKSATVIHVTHDYREAMALSDRVAVLHQGRIMQVGPPGEIFHHPANEFVASFVGDPPMSFIDVEYVEKGGQSFFHVEGSPVLLPAKETVGAYVNSNGLPNQLRIGVRAVSVTVSDIQKKAYHVPAKTYVTETMGFRNLLTVLTAQLGKSQVRVFTSPNVRFEKNQNVYLDLGKENVHVFADGAAIAHPTVKKELL